jgi:hypothetical protein
MRSGAALRLFLLLALAPSLAWAQALVDVRSGDHAGLGRLVFEWSAPVEYSLDHTDRGATIRFPGTVPQNMPGIGRPPRNVSMIATEDGMVRITVRPGTAIRPFKLDNRIVLDFLDPTVSRTARAGVVAKAASRMQTAAGAAQPDSLLQPAVQSSHEAGNAIVVADTSRRRPARARRRGPTEAVAPPVPTEVPTPDSAPVTAPPPMQVEVAPAPQAAEAAAAPTVTQNRIEDAVAADPPMSTAVAQKPAPAARLIGLAGRNQAVLLPYGTDTGAAILRRGNVVLIAFDSAEPLDLTRLRSDPAFGALEMEAVAGGTLFRLPLAAPGVIRARREVGGWLLELVRPADGSGQVPGARTIGLETQGEASQRLALVVSAPGRVLPVLDPETGMPLLLGTVRQGGQAMTTARRLPEIDLPETMLGAAFLARSDNVAIRPGADRFLVQLSGGARFALDQAAAQPAAGLSMTRTFDLPSQSSAQIFERVKALQSGIGNAAPLNRLPQRQAIGEAYLAIGMPQEAQSSLALGFAEDPRARENPTYMALSAVAALLSGRIADAGPLRAADLPETDEIRLWRAVLSASQGDESAAAPGFAATLPLLIAYPPALRARLLPMAGYTLAVAGDRAALRQLLARAGTDPVLTLATAMLADLEGQTDAALAGYDQAAQGRDRLARARAIRRAIELRLKAGRIDAAQAAKALEASLFAWRDDTEEIATRLRIAVLRKDAGDGRGALALLRETQQLFPNTASAVEGPMAEAFIAAIENDPPLAAISLFDAYPELLPSGPQGDVLIQSLAERLVELDLGDRASIMLRDAMKRAEGGRRAAVGYRLATLRFGEGDLAEARAALTESSAVPIDPKLAQDRAILTARLDARQGHLAEATASLREIGPAGLEPLSEILAEAQDWAGSAKALAGHLVGVLPAPPAELQDAERKLVLRQAVLLALAGDDRGLAALRATQLGRMRDGPMADAFASLTADSVKGLSDLPRLQRELQIFRRLPIQLDALRGSDRITR